MALNNEESPREREESDLGEGKSKLYGRSKQGVSYLDVIELKDPQCFLNLGIYGTERC